MLGNPTRVEGEFFRSHTDKREFYRTFTEQVSKSDRNTLLTRFLDDVNIPVDNNASERALRVITLGRKNFLLFGHEQVGENIASLYTLVASCEAVGVNPVEYLMGVLIRIQDHPADRIDEPLPHRTSRVAHVEAQIVAA